MGQAWSQYPDYCHLIILLSDISCLFSVSSGIRWLLLHGTAGCCLLPHNLRIFLTCNSTSTCVPGMISSLRFFWTCLQVFSPTRDEARIAEGKATFLKALSVLEEFFLSRGTLFIAASHPTVADLLAACDLAQICMIEDSGFSIESFPKLKAWFNTMRSQPHYEALHEAVMSRKKIEFWH